MDTIHIIYKCIDVYSLKYTSTHLYIVKIKKVTT